MPDHLLPWLLSTHTLLSALGLLVYALMSHVLRQRRHPSAAVGWVLLLLSAPYVGIPLYLAFGSRKLPRARRPVPLGGSRPASGGSGASGAVPIAMPAIAPALPAASWLTPLAASMGLPPPAAYRALRLHEDGRAAAEALWEVIDSARVTLDVCTFLLGHDVLGDAVADRLAERARAGVRVRLMVDGIGLLMGGRRDLHALAARGVRVARFVPPWRSPLKGRLNLRNHRKLVIADGERLWCGGRNLAAEYFVGSGRRGAAGCWLDLSFDLRGTVAAQALVIFENDWKLAAEEAPALPGHVGSAGAPRAMPAAAHAPVPVPVPDPDPPTRGPVGDSPAPAFVQLVPSGPDYSEDTLHALLVTACYRAQRRIRAVTPYLVPDDNLLTALVLAARRGVQIELLLPASSNHRLADLARRRALRELVAAGASVRLVPRMVHAKAVVFDDVLALAGSANLDARSLFLNYELMVAFDAPADVARFDGALDAIAVDARAWRPAVTDPGLARRLAEGLVLWLAFQL